jgi:hypothetical protein
MVLESNGYSVTKGASQERGSQQVNYFRVICSQYTPTSDYHPCTIKKAGIGVGG